jgi:hypothetical protein
MEERIDTDTYYLDVIKVMTSGITLPIPLINHESTFMTDLRHVRCATMHVWEHFIDVSPDIIYSLIYSDFARAYPSIRFGAFCNIAMKTDLAFANAEYLLTCCNILLKEYKKHNQLSIRIPRVDDDFAHRQENIRIPLRRI